MGTYTEQLDHIIETISPEDDNYTEELMAVMASFREFGEALDAFIVDKGYKGDITDVKAKVAFIKSKFDQAGIQEYPRNMKKWFTDQVRIKDRQKDRRTIFQLCFAFELDVQESEAFCQKVCLQRGFDCHMIEEAVFYYAIKHHLSYNEAMDIIHQVPKPDQQPLDLKGDVLFTQTITKEIDRFQSSEELIAFFIDNLDQFGYNNATAYRTIHHLWDTIQGPQGLANKEREILFAQDKPKEAKKLSTWDIYMQILGFYEFDDDHSPLFAFQDRSLKPILKNNALLHPLAEDCFPDRQGLEHILRGAHKSNELVRKTMILLAFYVYWTKWCLKNRDATIITNAEDCQRCYYEMNHYLVEAGYPALYAGNPYDWIFLYAMQDDYPLDTFRYFMKELYVHNQNLLYPLADASEKPEA
ncbi:MAG TPA: hypothetical protein IAD15_02335 [Candidatus Fimiplasma intestinipullorum]|uniref:Uncharacterized protein n=1 Tax=Candidatus Fimiplasma intestinipullorum TaxID=2840825 RepID=A0A9D1KYV1_9FIRM|nr:hypothetical protein [Candidatus Fimiplasma intestinipullorum]